MPLTLNLNGREYELPALEDLTLDETILLERYAGANIAQIEQMEDVPLGAVKALAIVGVMRIDPSAREADVAKAVGALKLTELGERFVASQDAEEGETPTPPNGSPEQRSDSDSREPSGETSSGAGEASPGYGTDPNPSGTLRSADSAASDRETSAA